MRRILYISGLSNGTRAKDLAFEFERYGPLVRCDIPVPKGSPNATPYAFVEYRSSRDAEAAHRDMHKRKIDGYRIEVEWAKNPPSTWWRQSGPGPSSRRRSRSPPRRDGRNGREYERRSYDRPRSRSRGRDRDNRERRRSRSPRREDERDRESARYPEEKTNGHRYEGRTPPPVSARTPPYRERGTPPPKTENGHHVDERVEARTPPRDS